MISWRASHPRPTDPAETINSFYHFGIVPATGKAEVNGTDPALRNYTALFPPGLADFTSPDWRVKAAALERLVAGKGQSVPGLVAGIRTTNEKPRDCSLNVSEREVERHCAIALARIADSATCETVLNCLDSPDREAHREMVRVIAAMHCDNGIPALLKLWSSFQEDKTNKREAAFALAATMPTCRARTARR